MDRTLRVRALAVADVERLYKLYMTSDVHLFTTPFWRPWGLQDFQQFIAESLARADVFRLGICKLEANCEELIGFVELNHLNWVHGTAEVGITILPVDDRSKGYGTSAVRLVTAWAFNTLRLRRVHAKMFATNPASKKCFEKVGFKFEGTWRQHFYVNGEPVDALLYGMLREEFVNVE